MFRTLVTTTLLLFVTPQIMAAVDDPRDGGRYRVVTTDGRTVNLFHAYIDADGISGTRFSGAEVTIGRGDITAVDYYQGSRSRQMGWIGAGIGAIFGFLIICGRQSDDRRTVDAPKDAMTLVLMTGCGGVLGLCVGALTPRWEEVDTSYNWSVDSRPIPGLTLTVHF